MGCCWIEWDLCSACATLPQILSTQHGRDYLQTVIESLQDRGCVEGAVVGRHELEVDVYAD